MAVQRQTLLVEGRMAKYTLLIMNVIIMIAGGSMLMGTCVIPLSRCRAYRLSPYSAALPAHCTCRLPILNYDRSSIASHCHAPLVRRSAPASIPCSTRPSAGRAAPSARLLPHLRSPSLPLPASLPTCCVPALSLVSLPLLSSPCLPPTSHRPTSHRLSRTAPPPRPTHHLQPASSGTSASTTTGTPSRTRACRRPSTSACSSFCSPAWVSWQRPDGI